MRFLAVLCLAGTAWGAQATSSITSVHTPEYNQQDDDKEEGVVSTSDYDPQSDDTKEETVIPADSDDQVEEDKEEDAAPASDDQDDDNQDESLIQSTSAAETEAAVTGWSRAMRVHRARHVRWMRSWSRRYNAWFRRSTSTYRARLAAARRRYAAARRNLKRVYGAKMRGQWRARRVGGLVRVVRDYQRRLRGLRIRQGRAMRSMASRYVRSRRHYRAVQLRRRSAHIRWYRRRMAQLKRLRRRRWVRRRRTGRRGGRRVFARRLTPLRRNKYVGAVRAAKSYQVSFNIKPWGTAHGWRNVLHFTTGGNYGREGWRIPGVWFFSRTTRLHIRASRRGGHNDGCDPRQHLPRHRNTRVTIRVAFGRLDVFYGRRLVCRNRNYRNPTVPRKRVKVYVADPWYHRAPARVGQVVYRRLGRSVRRVRRRWGGKMMVRRTTPLRRNKYVGAVRAAKSYQVSFNIKPWGTAHGWRNVLHFTTGGNYGREGWRIPGVWFFSRTTRLHIRASRRGGHNDGCDPRQHLPRHRNTKVTIRVAHGRLDVFFGRRLVCRSRNYRNPTVPRKRVKVYVADPWYHRAPARVGQVVYKRLR